MFCTVLILFQSSFSIHFQNGGSLNIAASLRQHSYPIHIKLPYEAVFIMIKLRNPHETENLLEEPKVKIGNSAGQYQGNIKIISA